MGSSPNEVGWRTILGNKDGDGDEILSLKSSGAGIGNILSTLPPSNINTLYIIYDMSMQ